MLHAIRALAALSASLLPVHPPAPASRHVRCALQPLVTWQVRLAILQSAPSQALRQGMKSLALETHVLPSQPSVMTNASRHQTRLSQVWRLMGAVFNWHARTHSGVLHFLAQVSSSSHTLSPPLPVQLPSTVEHNLSVFWLTQTLSPALHTPPLAGQSAAHVLLDSPMPQSPSPQVLAATHTPATQLEPGSPQVTPLLTSVQLGPVSGSQLSVVQSFRSSTPTPGPLMQVPPAHLSSEVQTSPSLQGELLLAWTQPAFRSQLSFVQALPSSQLSTVPLHVPPLQVPPLWHLSVALQAPVLGVLLQPLPGTQLSSVQGFLSSQVLGVPVQSAPLRSFGSGPHVSGAVHGSPSSQGPVPNWEKHPFWSLSHPLMMQGLALFSHTLAVPEHLPDAHLSSTVQNRLSSQGAPTDFAVNLQLPLVQTSSVQVFLSSQTFAVPLHALLTHTSPIVQPSPSLQPHTWSCLGPQLTSLSPCAQPLSGLQVSSVHSMPSSQLTGVTLQIPTLHAVLTQLFAGNWQGESSVAVTALHSPVGMSQVPVWHASLNTLHSVLLLQPSAGGTSTPTSLAETSLAASTASLAAPSLALSAAASSAVSAAAASSVVAVSRRSGRHAGSSHRHSKIGGNVFIWPCKFP